MTRLLGEGLVGIIGVALPILDPTIGIAITIAILFIVKNAAVAVWTRLIDGIEPKILAAGVRARTLRICPASGELEKHGTIA